MKLRLNNKYLNVKKRNPHNELLIEFDDTDILFLEKWFNDMYDTKTGLIYPAINYKRDIFFIEKWFNSSGIIRGCYISDIDFNNTATIHFDHLEYIDPVEERNKKIKKIKNGINI